MIQPSWIPIGFFCIHIFHPRKNIYNLIIILLFTLLLVLIQKYYPKTCWILLIPSLTILITYLFFLYSTSDTSDLLMDRKLIPYLRSKVAKILF